LTQGATHSAVTSPAPRPTGTTRAAIGTNPSPTSPYPQNLRPDSRPGRQSRRQAASKPAPPRAPTEEKSWFHTEGARTGHGRGHQFRANALPKVTLQADREIARRRRRSNEVCQKG